MPDKNWQFELEEYIKQGEPDRAEKSEAWQTAIGLQAVDGLNTSEYLLDTAKEHIEGKITIDEAQKRIHSYYEQRSVRTETENETKEADIVSARITKLLGEKAFQFSPAEWIAIHRRLFVRSGSAVCAHKSSAAEKDSSEIARHNDERVFGFASDKRVHNRHSGGSARLAVVRSGGSRCPQWAYSIPAQRRA